MFRKFFVISLLAASLTLGCDDSSDKTPGDQNNQKPDGQNNQKPDNQNNQNDPTLTACGDFRCDTKKGEKCIEVLASRDMAYDPILKSYLPLPEKTKICASKKAECSVGPIIGSDMQVRVTKGEMQFCADVTGMYVSFLSVRLPDKKSLQICGDKNESKPWDECLCVGGRLWEKSDFREASATVCEKGTVCDFKIGACKQPCTSDCSDGLRCVDALSTEFDLSGFTPTNQKICLEPCSENGSSCACGSVACSASERCVSIGEKKACAQPRLIRSIACKDKTLLSFGESGHYICAEKDHENHLVVDSQTLPACKHGTDSDCVCSVNEGNSYEYCGNGEKCVESGCIKKCRSDDDCPSKHCDTTYGLCNETCVPGVLERDCTYGEAKEICLIGKEYASAEINGKIKHFCEDKLFYAPDKLPDCKGGKIFVIDMGLLHAAKCASDLPDFELKDIKHCLFPKSVENCLCNNIDMDGKDVALYCGHNTVCSYSSGPGEGFACDITGR